MKMHRLRRDESGAAVIEMAFALPAFLTLLWGLVQLGLVFRAMAGMQQALGEGARRATISPQPNDTAIREKMEAAVFGVGPGDFDHYVELPPASEGGADGGYINLRVTYAQDTDLLFFPGPTFSLERSKRVWVADPLGVVGHTTEEVPPATGGTGGGGTGGSGDGDGGGGSTTPTEPAPTDPTPTDPTPTNPTPTNPGTGTGNGNGASNGNGGGNGAAGNGRPTTGNGNGNGNGNG